MEFESLVHFLFGISFGWGRVSDTERYVWLFLQMVSWHSIVASLFGKHFSSQMPHVCMIFVMLSHIPLYTLASHFMLLHAGNNAVKDSTAPNLRIMFS